MDQDTIEGVVESQISNPRPASPEQTDVYMPADLVQGDDARDVAAYVASIAGVPGIEPPEFVAPEFFATNCGGCHTLGQAGTTGTVGPNLDQVLPGQSPMQISQSITEPGRADRSRASLPASCPRTTAPPCRPRTSRRWSSS